MHEQKSLILLITHRRLLLLPLFRSFLFPKSVRHLCNHGIHTFDQMYNQHGPVCNTKRSQNNLSNAVMCYVRSSKSEFLLFYLQKHRKGSQLHHFLFSESSILSVRVFSGSGMPVSSAHLLSVLPDNHPLQHLFLFHEILPMS